MVCFRTRGLSMTRLSCEVHRRERTRVWAKIPAFHQGTACLLFHIITLLCLHPCFPALWLAITFPLGYLLQITHVRLCLHTRQLLANPNFSLNNGRVKIMPSGFKLLTTSN